jgi:hypothetical protein
MDDTNASEEIDDLIAIGTQLDEIDVAIENTKHLLIQYPDRLSLQLCLESLKARKVQLEAEVNAKEIDIDQALELGQLLVACKAYGMKYNLTAKQVVGCIVDLLTNAKW